MNYIAGKTYKFTHDNHWYILRVTRVMGERVYGVVIEQFNPRSYKINQETWVNSDYYKGVLLSKESFSCKCNTTDLII